MPCSTVTHSRQLLYCTSQLYEEVVLESCSDSITTQLGNMENVT